MNPNLNTDVLGVVVSFLDIVEDKDTYKSLVVIYKLTDNESSNVFDYWLANSKVKCKTNSIGTKEWFINNKRHRENDLPTIEHIDGSKFWYVNDKLHRENDKPAIEYASGTKEWWINDQRHRDNGKPAIEYTSRRKEWWVNGKQYKKSKKLKI